MDTNTDNFIHLALRVQGKQSKNKGDLFGTQSVKETNNSLKTEMHEVNQCSDYKYAHGMPVIHLSIFRLLLVSVIE